MATPRKDGDKPLPSDRTIPVRPRTLSEYVVRRGSAAVVTARCRRSCRPTFVRTECVCLCEKSRSLHVMSNKRIKLRFRVAVALVIVGGYQPTVRSDLPRFLAISRPPRILCVSPTFIKRDLI